MMLPPSSSAWLAPYRSSPYSLRFELGGEGMSAPVPRFVRAYERARQLADDLFSASPCLFGVVAAPLGEQSDFYAPVPDAFTALDDAGFRGEAAGGWWGPLWPEQEEAEDQVPSRWRVFDLTDRQADRDVLLWCSVSYDMAITPKAPVVPFLLDVERSILLYVYDDRGMDVTALDKTALAALYTDRRDWLLPHDRERADRIFSAAP